MAGNRKNKRSTSLQKLLCLPEQELDWPYVKILLKVVCQEKEDGRIMQFSLTKARIFKLLRTPGNNLTESTTCEKSILLLNLFLLQLEANENTYHAINMQDKVE
jgi:hypothetical protein